MRGVAVSDLIANGAAADPITPVAGRTFPAEIVHV